MQEITDSDFRRYLKEHNEVTFHDRIGSKEIKIKQGEKKAIKRFGPKEFKLEYFNVWSFPNRGDWATHKGNYRGNWPPQLVRNVLLRYSKAGDTILDQMVGSGTTLVECKLLGRNAIGVDINPESIMLTRDRLDFTPPVTLNEFE